MSIELSIVILAYNEEDNLKLIVPKIKTAASRLTSDYEILIVDGNSSDETVKVAKSLGCRVISQDKPGYGNAFKQAFKELKGKYAINVDADCSHDPEFIKELWSKREETHLVIASRYIQGGKAEMPIFRRTLSLFLNKVYRTVLSLSYKDLSSGFRLYNVEAIRSLLTELSATDFDVLLEVFIKLYCKGYTISEIPFCYKPRKYGRSSVRLFKFAVSYLKTLYHSWQLRNSAFSADYDDRAFNSKIIFQRYWQRKRYEIIMNMTENAGSCIDLGCGSSRIIQNMPKSVGLDIDLNKLRYVKKNNNLLVKGDIEKLPFKDNVVPMVICSQVMEHIPKQKFNLNEINRIIKDKGILILGTPDYGSFWWNFIEWFYKKILPNAYGEGHIATYTKKELERILEESGFKIVEYKYICKGELILKTVKL